MLDLLRKKSVVREYKDTREFSYMKGHVNLKFLLRVDIKEDLVDFIECLKLAIEDVGKEIEKSK